MLGVNIKAGMEGVFNRVNEAGGVHGRQIKLIAYDHGYQPPKRWPMPNAWSSGIKSSS